MGVGVLSSERVRMRAPLIITQNALNDAYVTDFTNGFYYFWGLINWSMCWYDSIPHVGKSWKYIYIFLKKYPNRFCVAMRQKCCRVRYIRLYTQKWCVAFIILEIWCILRYRSNGFLLRFKVKHLFIYCNKTTVLCHFRLIQGRYSFSRGVFR